MGRPLTDRWIGNRSSIDSPVLTPTCNIGGNVGPCWILGQIGASKYAVQSMNDPSVRGQMQLTNGVVTEPGMGYLRWETAHASGYVKSITDRKLKTFHGATVEWSIYGLGETVAHVTSNSENQ